MPNHRPRLSEARCLVSLPGGCEGSGVMSVNVKGTCVPKQLRHMLSLPLQCHLASSNAARTRVVRRRTFYNRKQLTE